MRRTFTVRLRITFDDGTTRGASPSAWTVFDVSNFLENEAIEQHPDCEKIVVMSCYRDNAGKEAKKYE